MQINEVTQQVDLSKRAIKYYEEQGLLTVKKDSNGYRNYTEENLTTLKEIAVYRKLGINISDIKQLLKSKDIQLLETIYKQKASDLHVQQKQLEALRSYIQDHNVDRIYESVDYQTIAQALQDMIPGFYGYYFMNHFMPYLQIPITTKEQRIAYENIIQFWDNTTIRIPFFMKLMNFIFYRFTPKASMEQMVFRMESQIQQYLNPSEEEYKKLKEQTIRNVKLKNSLFYKYHPIFISQRKFMKQLQKQGYNDIFIPNMIALSPKYKEYHDALMNINNRICNDLGLFYDSNYNLILKKPNN
ncbi:MAG TPA: MerR family transcriptional regulator [Candidatus Fimimorpha faecalis]|uniref:MerR family transcriptional regulator n=1 Tax=Candidatus Fimimorpha faecalis TaxID=2840824 RepID=A0A9D1EE09_9FIRM|nr:MerR family transcriptional regulator [Candidatus Fimimorpha faecalis]